MKWEVLNYMTGNKACHNERTVMIRKLSKKQVADVAQRGLVCSRLGCGRPATHIDWMGSDESEYYCEVCAGWADEADKQYDSNYRLGLQDGQPKKMPDCLLKDKARLAENRRARIEQIRDMAMAAQMESWYEADVADWMSRGCPEVIARSRLLHETGCSKREAVELACGNTPGTKKPNKKEMKEWLQDWKRGERKAKAKRVKA